MKKIIAFSGSNSSGSINQALIYHVAELIDCDGVHIEILDLHDMEVPIYSIDLEQQSGIPAPIIELKEKLSEADAFIIASPEHNGALPAFFKNIIDWLSRIDQKIFNHRKVVLLSASPGAKGGESNLTHLATLLPHWGGKVIGKLSIGRFDQFIESERVKLPNEYCEKLQRLLFKLCSSILIEIDELNYQTN